MFFRWEKRNSRKGLFLLQTLCGSTAITLGRAPARLIAFRWAYFVQSHRLNTFWRGPFKWYIQERQIPDGSTGRKVNNAVSQHFFFPYFAVLSHGYPLIHRHNHWGVNGKTFIWQSNLWGTCTYEYLMARINYNVSALQYLKKIWNNQGLIRISKWDSNLVIQCNFHWSIFWLWQAGGQTSFSSNHSSGPIRFLLGAKIAAGRRLEATLRCCVKLNFFFFFLQKPRQHFPAVIVKVDECNSGMKS